MLSERVNRNDVLKYVKREVMPDLLGRFDVEVDYSDQSRMESNTLNEMKYGLWVALAGIYFLLVWGFGSFSLPWLVILTMPLALIGALWGHYWLGFDLSILSFMGFFGLMGIIVNDSIILIRAYQRLVKSGLAVRGQLWRVSLNEFVRSF